jgi:Uma2 family endonuclease
MTAAAAELSTPLPLPDPGELGFTVADLHALPDDGPRYELIDGSLIVSPSATGGHNTIARWIADALDNANPGDDYFVSTDVSAQIDKYNEPRPDVVVYRSEHVDESPFPMHDALLVVEVISRTSALHDTETKRVLYARAGVPAYWIVVPELDKPTITLAELVLDPQAGRYNFVTHYTANVFHTDYPWPVTIDLPALTAKRARWFRRNDWSRQPTAVFAQGVALLRLRSSCSERVSIGQADEFGYTVDYLHSLPDDGVRRELIDGSIVRVTLRHR